LGVACRSNMTALLSDTVGISVVMMCIMMMMMTTMCISLSSCGRRIAVRCMGVCLVMVSPGSGMGWSDQLFHGLGQAGSTKIDPRTTLNFDDWTRQVVGARARINCAQPCGMTDRNTADTCGKSVALL